MDFFCNPRIRTSEAEFEPMKALTWVHREERYPSELPFSYVFTLVFFITIETILSNLQTFVDSVATFGMHHRDVQFD